MSHLLHDYVAEQLGGHVDDRQVVVWFDPRREFESFIAELEMSEEADGLTNVSLGGASMAFARFDGSVYALRSRVGPLVDGDDPSRLVIYLPGLDRTEASPLMELELAGYRWEPQLRRLARNALRQRFTDGVIDELLGRENLTYADIAQAAGDDGDRSPSVLKAILSGATSEAQIANWLAAPDVDGVIVEKGAPGELAKLVTARLGISLGDEDLAKWRSITMRFVLGSEFRSDLRTDPPEALGNLPACTTEVEQRVRAIAGLLRKEHGDTYPAIADQAERELGLNAASVDALLLGSVDTFRFEEQALLGQCASLIHEGRFAEVLDVAETRRGSFWLAHDVERQAQWEAVRLSAVLGEAAESVADGLAAAPTSSAGWIERYEQDWHRLDRAHRKLESWLPKLDDEADERAVSSVRHRYDSVLDTMAQGFAKAMVQNGWSVEGVRHQTSVFDDLVRPDRGRVAYFLVDAMRYEMGVELAERLSDYGETTISAATGVLPSITTTGMAALMPGALESYDLTVEGGKLGAAVDGTFLADLKARKKHMAARVPSSVDLALEDLVQLSKAKLAKKIGDADLVVVRSQEIDLFGEGGSSLARSVMDTVIDNLARAARKLAAVGIERAVISSDHGHLYASEDRDDSMKIDAPGGEQVELHRRCWIGRGGATPSACVRVGARDLGNDLDLDFVFPAGTGVFKSGGDLSFHHGGPTLQEMVIPVITFRSSSVAPESHGSADLAVADVPAVITNRMFSVKLSYASLLGTDLPVLPILEHDGQQVGAVGMAIEGELLSTGAVALTAGAEATLGFRLDDDRVESARIVILDPATDAVLYRSPEDILVQLGVF